MTSTIVVSILQIFGMFSVGWLAAHLGYIRQDELDRWSHFVIDFLFPALVFHTIIRNVDAAQLAQLWLLPAVGFGMIAVGAGLGFALRLGLRRESPDLVRTFHHFCAINNYGYLPIIIVQGLWGEAGLAKLFLLNVGSNVGYWTIGVGLLGGGSLRQAARKILTPSLVALFSALLLCLTGWRVYVPGIVLYVTQSIGVAAIPCVLILIGASLYPLPRLRQRGALAYLAVVRLAALPLVLVGILSLLRLPAEARAIAYVVALMPTSVTSTILTRRYGGDPDYAAGAAVVTTCLSLVTVPLGLALIFGGVL